MADPRTIIVPKAVRGSPARFLFREDSYTTVNSVAVFQIERAGRRGQTVSVDWAITGVGMAPFNDSGTVTFNPGEKVHGVQVTSADAGGTGVLKLSNPQYISGGSDEFLPVLGSRTVIDFVVVGTPSDEDIVVGAGALTIASQSPADVQSDAVMWADTLTELGMLPPDYIGHQLLRTVAQHINLHEDCSFDLSAGTHTLIYAHPTLNDHTLYQPDFLSSWSYTGKTGSITTLDRDGSNVVTPVYYYSKSVSGTFTWRWTTANIQDQLSYFVGVFLVPPGVTLSNIFPELYKVISDISIPYVAPASDAMYWDVTPNVRPATTHVASSWANAGVLLNAASAGDVIQLPSTTMTDEGQLIIQNKILDEDNPVWLVPSQTTLAGSVVLTTILEGDTAIQFINCRGFRVWGLACQGNYNGTGLRRFDSDINCRWVRFENIWFNSDDANTPDDLLINIRLRGHYCSVSNTDCEAKVSKGQHVEAVSTTGNDTASQFNLIQYNHNHESNQGQLLSSGNAVNAAFHMGGSENSAERQHGILRRNKIETWKSSPSQTASTILRSCGWIVSENVGIADATDKMSFLMNRRASWTTYFGNYYDHSNVAVDVPGLQLHGSDPALGAEYADTNIIIARHFVQEHNSTNGYLDIRQVASAETDRFIANECLLTEIYAYNCTDPVIEFDTETSADTPSNFYCSSIAVQTSSAAVDEQFDSTTIPVTWEGCMLNGIAGIGFSISGTPSGVVGTNPVLSDRGDGVFVSDHASLAKAVTNCVPVALSGSSVANLGLTYTPTPAETYIPNEFYKMDGATGQFQPNIAPNAHDSAFVLCVPLPQILGDWSTDPGHSQAGPTTWPAITTGDGGGEPGAGWGIEWKLDSWLIPDTGQPGYASDVIPARYPPASRYFLASSLSNLDHHQHAYPSSGEDKTRYGFSPGSDQLHVHMAEDDDFVIGFSIFLPPTWEVETNQLFESSSCMILEVGTQASRDLFSLHLGTWDSGTGLPAKGGDETHWELCHTLKNDDVAGDSRSLISGVIIDGGNVADDVGVWTDFVLKLRSNPFTVQTNAANAASGGVNQVFEGNKGRLQIWKGTGPTIGQGDDPLYRHMQLVVNKLDQPMGLVPNGDPIRLRFKHYVYDWGNPDDPRHPIASSIVGRQVIGFAMMKWGSVAAHNMDYRDVHPSFQPRPNTTVIKDGSGDYTTIQAAINDALPGGTIEVRANSVGGSTTYNEALTFGPSGTSSNRIILKARSSDDIQITGTTFQNLINATDNDFWSIRNFRPIDDGNSIAKYGGTGLDETRDELFYNFPHVCRGYDWSVQRETETVCDLWQNQADPTDFHPDFKGEHTNAARLLKLNSKWKELKPTQNGPYDWSTWDDALQRVTDGDYEGIVVQFRGILYDDIGTLLRPDQHSMPEWLVDDLGANLITEPLHSSGFRAVNGEWDDPIIYTRFVELLDELGNQGYMADPRVIGVILHGCSGSQGEEWTGDQADGSADAENRFINTIFPAWFNAVGANAKKCCWLKETPNSLWDAANAAGMGNRGGAIEGWLRQQYTNEQGDPEVERIGMYVDTDGHFVIDETFNNFVEQRYWMDENEAGYNQVPDENDPQNYRYANMRMAQMRRNSGWIDRGMGTDHRCDIWFGMTSGNLPGEASEAWCLLMQTYARYSGNNNEINNFECFLQQRESEGATTLGHNRDHGAGTNPNVALLPEAFRNIWTTREPSGTEIGFSIQDGFFATSGPHNVAVKVLYIDSGSQTIELRYNNGSGARSGTKFHTKTNTGSNRLKTATFYIDDLYNLASGLNADFYLAEANTEFSFIRVIKLLE